MLVVEDDPNIVDLLRSNLLVRGYEVEVSTTGEDAQSLLERWQPDVALVDLMHRANLPQLAEAAGGVLEGRPHWAANQGRLLGPLALRGVEWLQHAILPQESVMNVETIRDEGQKLRYPTGKILGIVDSQTVLDGLARAMENAGFTSIQVLSGEEGVSLLERSERFFFSDMEDRVIARHIEELKAGHLIIAIKAPSNRVDEAVTLATENGARRLVHFGWATVTWLTK